jgi:hypothetical protein
MSESDEISNLLDEVNNDSASRDFETARANLLEVIETAKTSLHELSNLAQQSQHPRSYEVLSGLVSTIVMANKDLLDLQIKIRSIRNADAPITSTKNITNNNLFLSTAELAKMIAGVKDEQKIIEMKVVESPQEDGKYAG